jgi:hypothetical protein
MQNRTRVLGLLVGMVLLCLTACGEDDHFAPAQATPTPAPQQLCLDSGGQVTTITCFCPGTEDFFNTCGLGACTCPPGNSHQVLSCDCGAGRCFNGSACAPQG